MITHRGSEIPDPPSDPEQRRLWKTIYYAELYGASPEMIRKMLTTPPLPCIKSHCTNFAIDGGAYCASCLPQSRVFQPEPVSPRLVRLVVISIVTCVGGVLVIEGAAHDLWRVALFGLVLHGVTLGYIIGHVSPRVTRTIRSNTRAMWRALFLVRMFRRWL